jgi:hypothetical protein
MALPKVTKSDEQSNFRGIGNAAAVYVDPTIRRANDDGDRPLWCFFWRSDETAPRWRSRLCGKDHARADRLAWSRLIVGDNDGRTNTGYRE